MIKLDKSQVTRNLGKKYKYVPYLEKAIATFEDPWTFTYEEKEADKFWHPSSHVINGKGQPYSLLDLWAIANDEVEHVPHSGSLRKTFQVGHFWHQWLQFITLEKLRMCQPEAVERKGMYAWGPSKKPAPFHAVSGSGDLAPLEAPGWTGLVDYKTMNSRNYSMAGIPPSFDAKYECQINIYMDLFDQDEGIILPINKDTGEFKEFLYERNQPLVDAIYERWEFVSACLDAGDPPSKADEEMFPPLLDLLEGAVST